MTQRVRLRGVRAAGFQNGAIIAVCDGVGAEALQRRVPRYGWAWLQPTADSLSTIRQ